MLAEASREERIVGGNNSKFGSWPWQVTKSGRIAIEEATLKNGKIFSSSGFRSADILFRILKHASLWRGSLKRIVGYNGRTLCRRVSQMLNYHKMINLTNTKLQKIVFFSLLVSQIRMRMGEFDFSSVQEPYPFIERGVNKKIVHPKYNFFTYEYDLALVRLEEPITFQPNIAPICLPAMDESLIGQNAVSIQIYHDI